MEKWVLQRFLRSVSGTDTGRHRELPVPAPTGQDRHRYLPAQTGLDRPGLFYDVFDKNFENIIPFLGLYRVIFF
jgi:hypothetical protein